MKKINIKRTTHLFWMAFVVVLPLLGACQKEEEMDEDGLRCPVTAVDGADDDIIGKWKLVKVEGSLMVPSRDMQKREDYSCDNVIYHFQEESLMVVSGVRDNMMGFGNGGYVFEFKNEPFLKGMDGYTLQIRDRTMRCLIQDNNMTMDESHVDGSVLYFVRVE